jgi:nitrite reductase/ring-hydroxylating ferredoxin subunit
MTGGNDWHPVGLSGSVEPASSAGTRLFGQELVIWRDAGGAAHVWEDRCPHRGMKLSFGFVRGDHIACLYHGWRYDTGGHCRYIPAHPDLDVPKTIKVPVYPTRELGGMIWTTLSDQPVAPPDPDEASVPLRSLYLDCSVDHAIAALGSASLVPFATDAPADTTIGRISDTLFALSCAQDRILVGLQAISNTRIALHLSICGSPEVYAGAGQTHFLAWALQLRHALEQQPPAARAHAVVAAEAG